MSKIEELADSLNSLGVQCTCEVHELTKEINGSSLIPDHLSQMLEVFPSHQIKAKSSKGEISIIHAGISMNTYEIYCICGDLFDGPIRYSEMEECVEAIQEFLR